MAKNIVFCADGTWDSSANGTNVYRLFKACSINATQVAYYDDGVGSDGTPIEKLLGGAFGTGLFQKIKEGYSKIAHVYESGDHVFLFGFSRGAYTARSLGGMITASGLPTQNFDDALVDTAFHAYRDRDDRAKILAGIEGKYAMEKPKITMVGVWDTVGSLGIPSLFGGVDPLLYSFLDTSLSPNILNAYQAIAINERRSEFPPTLWTGTPVPGQTMEQVLFAGVHCDVGGGYPEHGLSDITLAWMGAKAVALGLQIDPAAASLFALPDSQHALDKIHESWTPLWGFPCPRKLPDPFSVGNSVQIRCDHDASYQPGTLAHAGTKLAASYTIIPVVTDPS